MSPVCWLEPLLHAQVFAAGDALEMLDRCIQHSPTLLELYTVQCKILKHAGDAEGAAAAADKARSMDLADRCCSLPCSTADLILS